MVIKPERTVCFLILPNVHLFDLTGPAQVFHEASDFGPCSFKLLFAATGPQVRSDQGLLLGDLTYFSEIQLKEGDFIFIPGINFQLFKEGKLKADIALMGPWLKNQFDRGVRIASVCSGALILADTGILNRRKCTSHWKCIDYLKSQYPQINVLVDCLYVQDETLYSSAGMASGIDMTLSILESLYGPVLPAKVAREMVVYLRRNNTDKQATIFLDYRTHFNPSVHRVQDYIISNPSKNPSLRELALVGNISVRNLTRTFKKATGHTIHDFKNAVKVELAQTEGRNWDIG